MQDPHRGYHRSHQKCFSCCVFPFISHQFSATLHSVHCFTTHTIQCSTLHCTHAPHALHTLHTHTHYVLRMHCMLVKTVKKNTDRGTAHTDNCQTCTAQLCAWHWPTKSFNSNSTEHTLTHKLHIKKCNVHQVGMQIIYWLFVHKWPEQKITSSAWFKAVHPLACTVKF